MTPRVLLFTGKGGVGKSTLAAATAALAAANGTRTLLLSTDAAHSLADAFDVPIGPEPTNLGAGLWVQQIDTQRGFERAWAELSRYLRAVLDTGGVNPVVAEELAVLPGADEVLSLLEVHTQATSGAWETIVIDCAPSAETLRLLSLPQALASYRTRLFANHGKLVRTVAALVSNTVGAPPPSVELLRAVEELLSTLEQVHDLLTGPRASVRLVTTPERVVLAEARRNRTALALFGYRVDGVLVNRIFPDGADPWRANWVAAQASVLAEMSDSFADLPTWRTSYRAAEPVGRHTLEEVARETYRDSDPLRDPPDEEPWQMHPTSDGAHLRLPLPAVSAADVDLIRRGDDIVVSVGSYRRVLALPRALAPLRVAGARVREGSLQVRFQKVRDE